MKNKTAIIILVILGIALAVLAGVYFAKQNKLPVDSSDNTAQENQNSAPENSAQPQDKLDKLATDDFSINLPAGWKQAAPPMGSSAMAVNSNEYLNDPAAQKINFKSYFAVSYDTLQGKSMSEYLQTVKNQLQQVIPDVIFTKEQDMTINGISAHAIEAELTQQGVNFKILMVVVTGQGEDVWVISFNTIKSSWDGYKEIFYSVANSFSLILN